MPAPSWSDVKSTMPGIGVPGAVVIIGLVALGLLLALHFGFKPLNLK